MVRTRAWTSMLSALGLTLAVPAGARAQECSEDADCAEGFECDLEASGAASRPDCPPESDCDPAPEPEPAPPRGECEPAELTCMSDSDCPGGAVCVRRRSDCGSTDTDSGSDSGDSEGSDAAPTPGSGSGAGGSGGDDPAPDAKLPAAAPEEECEPATEGQCVYTLVECKADSDCEGGDLCTEFDGGGACSEEPDCAGDGCPEDDEEPVCEQTTISWCFPKPVDCSDGQKCGDGTRCVVLPEDVNDDAPASWNGASALCLPELWALAFEERIEIDGGKGSSEAASDGKGVRSDSLGNSDDDAAEDDGTNAAAANDDCAVSAPGSDGAGGLWPPVFGAAALLLGVRMRRTQRGRRA